MKRGYHPASILCLLAALTSCDDGTLEVRGTLDRVVGETVTLELVEGEPAFSGDLSLVSPKKTFAASGLQVIKSSDTKLSFVIPTDIFPGKSTVELGRKGNSESYEVPLQINRLAVALNNKGVVEILPIPPATLASGSLKNVNAANGLVSMTASGGEVAILAKDQLSMLTLDRDQNSVFPAIQQKDAIAMVALPQGALICTNSLVILIKSVGGKITNSPLTFAGCKALAVNETGTLAAVLFNCDSNNDLTNEDCFTTLAITSNLQQGVVKSLDSTPSATHVAIRKDGKGAVVVDTDVIHGIWGLDSSSYQVNTVPWGSSAAVPVAVARGESNLGDLFAVAESSLNRIIFVAFDPAAGNVLKVPNQMTMTSAPSAISFGRGSDLYVASGIKLYLINAKALAPVATALSISASSDITYLMTQP